MQKIENYKRKVQKLHDLESKLINLISECDNEEIKNTFLEWQKYINICNNSQSEIFDELAEKVKDNFKK